MAWFKRKPRITEDVYGRLITSFGRVVDRDPMIAQPAEALAQKVVAEEAELAGHVDKALYRGAALYHLRLLAGSWIMSSEGSIPVNTAEVFEEAVAWKFEPVARGSQKLPRRVSALARGEGLRDVRQD